MISQSQIKSKALKWWTDGSFLGSVAGATNFFPKDLSQIGLVKHNEKSTEFLRISEQQKNLYQDSKDIIGYGYKIEWEERNHRSIGRNRFIKRIYFETEEDFIRFVNKRKELEKFKDNLALINARLPRLSAWANDNPQIVANLNNSWSEILNVCEYFVNTHESDRFFIRELPIRVHTKFVESNKELFYNLLNFLLPEERINAQYAGLKNFEKRFGLKFNEPLIRIRVLDDSIAKVHFSGLTDICITQSEFSSLAVPFKNAIIMENKTNYSNIMNFLTLPNLKGTFAIFGSGFKIGLLKSASWLESIKIFYWGDIDAQGIQILSQLRGYHSQVQSVMMDLNTLNNFKNDWVDGTETAVLNLKNLTEEEFSLFKLISTEGNRIRLEQEKIPHEYVVKELDKVIGRHNE